MVLDFTFFSVVFKGGIARQGRGNQLQAAGSLIPALQLPHHQLPLPPAGTKPSCPTSIASCVPGSGYSWGSPGCPLGTQTIPVPLHASPQNSRAGEGRVKDHHPMVLPGRQSLPLTATEVITGSSCSTSSGGGKQYFSWVCFAWFWFSSMQPHHDSKDHPSPLAESLPGAQSHALTLHAASTLAVPPPQAHTLAVLHPAKCFPVHTKPFAVFPSPHSCSPLDTPPISCFPIRGRPRHTALCKFLDAPGQTDLCKPPPPRS